MPQANAIYLDATPSAVQQARSFTANSLREWGLPGLIDDAVLVVSELATNAVKASRQHRRPTMTVCLWTEGGSLVVQVWDAAPGIPLPDHSTAGEMGGRGLAVVDALSRDWGCCPHVSGKLVWAHLCPAG